MATGDGEKMDEKYQGSGAAGSGDNRRIYAINSTNVRYIVVFWMRILFVLNPTLEIKYWI